ncbi:E3 ubiquitin protein ligase DRIP1 [Spatholobus suberectus]|nr:E3 ubiquitin protein ligase DRIP1 [Spatholobus suberectus]
MTMVPSQNGKQNRSSGDYVICGNTTTSSAMNQVEVEGGYNCLLGSDFAVRRHMAGTEESSRHNPTANEEAEAGGSTSKEEEEGGGGTNNNNNWLQLSIGLTSAKQDGDRTVPITTGSGLVELDLLPSRRSSEQPPAIFPVAASGRGGGSSFGGSSSLLLEHQTASSSSSLSVSMASGPITSTFGHQEMMNWAFGPLLPHSMPIMPSPSSFTPLPSSSSSSSSQSCYSSLRPPLGPYFPTPFHHFPSSSGFDQYDVAGAGPSSDVTVRVVDPPRRPHSGIWFMLQASQNQAKEPFLPQIPKNYLRIKDGRMTVRLLLKYLVSKLRLESESEIEITCRGQQLLPFLTLQHVRDNIWTPRDTTRALLSDSSTTDHVMVLHYGRSTT